MTLRETRSCGHLLRYDTLSPIEAAVGKLIWLSLIFTILTTNPGSLEIFAGNDYHIGRHQEWHEVHFLLTPCRD